MTLTIALMVLLVVSMDTLMEHASIIVSLCFTETVLLSHWLHEKAEHLMRLVELAHIGHSAVFA